MEDPDLGNRAPPRQVSRPVTDEPIDDDVLPPSLTAGRDAWGMAMRHRDLIQRARLVTQQVNAHLEQLLDLVADEREAVVCPLGSWTLATRLGTWATNEPEPVAEEDLSQVADWASTHPELRSVFAVWLRGATSADPMVGTLTGNSTVDQETVDTWARVATDGLIPEMPVRLREETAGVAAHAALLRTAWTDSFDLVHRPVIPATDRWLPEGQWLRRTTGDWDIGVVTGAKPRSSWRKKAQDTVEASWARIRGGTTDIWLCCSPGGDLSGRQLAVLASEVAAGRATTKLGTALAAGEWAGLVVTTERSSGPRFESPTQSWQLCHPFDLTALVPLESHPSFAPLIGRNLPGLQSLLHTRADVPIAVTQVSQSARAHFDETGFEAAAVTAAVIAPTAAPDFDDAPPPTYETRTVATMIADGLVGFATLDRETGFVLFAGWITT